MLPADAFFRANLYAERRYNCKVFTSKHLKSIRTLAPVEPSTISHGSSRGSSMILTHSARSTSRLSLSEGLAIDVEYA